MADDFKAASSRSVIARAASCAMMWEGINLPTVDHPASAALARPANIGGDIVNE